MDSTVSQCRHLLAQAEPILAGLEDAHLALEPRPGVKTAGWLVGHLAVTGDRAFLDAAAKRTRSAVDAWFRSASTA
mgnify:CR=1 FL=1